MFFVHRYVSWGDGGSQASQASDVIAQQLEPLLAPAPACSSSGMGTDIIAVRADTRLLAQPDAVTVNEEIARS